jgi:iron(III) transport system substrate-binding protein
MTEIEAAAKKEGRLVIYSAPGHANREDQEAIGQRMREKYGIIIEWTTMGGSGDMGQRILVEHRTKRYIADIVMDGIGGSYVDAKPRGYVAPILAPSTLEKDIWRLHPATLTLKDRDWFFIQLQAHAGIFVNTKLVSPGEEPKSYQDLLDPKWKGKIVYQSPGVGGPGVSWFRVHYKFLGLDYMGALAKQVAVVAAINDVPDGVARGQYAVGIAASPARGRQLQQEGAPVKYVHLKEGDYISVPGLYLLVNAPHPNAARAFINWFYSKEGQTTHSQHNLVISLRKDVPQDHLPPADRYLEGRSYRLADAEDITPEGSRRVMALGRQIFEAGK